MIINGFVHLTFLYLQCESDEQKGPSLVQVLNLIITKDHDSQFIASYKIFYNGVTRRAQCFQWGTRCVKSIGVVFMLGIIGFMNERPGKVPEVL